MTSRPKPVEEAVRWLVLRDERELTESELQAFDAWMRDADNAAAWREAQRSWNVFGVARDLPGQHPQLEALRRSALAMRPLPQRSLPGSESEEEAVKVEPNARPPLRPSRVLPFAAAAAVVIAVGAALLWKSASDENIQSAASAPLEQPVAVAAYSTQVGERREVSLPDGSRLNLNTGTEVQVKFAPGQRVVELRRGQATFDVAKDASRPFLVEAGERRVRAVGTVFDVYLAPDRLRVTLSEGKVTVGRLNAASEQELPLEPGQQLVASAEREVVSEVDISRALLWRDGMVEFNNESLGDAVAEMNRYTPFPVRIRDERTRSLRISGLFHTDRMEQFLQVVEELLPVKVTQNAGGQTEIAGRE